MGSGDAADVAAAADVSRTSTRLTKLAAPVVEQVAQRPAYGQGTVAKPFMVPTLLSQANRSTGRKKVRTKPKREARAAKPAVPAACQACGLILDEQDRWYCDDCLPEAQQEQVEVFSAMGLAEVRAAGMDPSNGGEVAKRRAAKLVQRMHYQAAWEAEHGSAADPEVFRLDILPCLQGVTSGAMAQATDLSEQYCSLIRRRRYMPHRRHWRSLANVTGKTI